MSASGHVHVLCEVKPRDISHCKWYIQCPRFKECLAKLMLNKKALLHSFCVLKKATWKCVKQLSYLAQSLHTHIHAAKDDTMLHHVRRVT